jgi:pyruvate dehydrogenase E2 component (dihydrolipoamide acetyltransferase)
MPVPIIMPKFGFTLETTTIVQWLKKDGDKVRSGDPICEVTTDKVNMEVEAPETGTLWGLQYNEGDEVPVTNIIAYVLRPGESAPADLAPTHAEAHTEVQAATHTESKQVSAEVPATPVAQRVAEAHNIDLNGIRGSGRNGRIMRRDVETAMIAPVRTEHGKIRATPAARHFAAEMGIDLAEVVGTGPRGRIQQADVEAVLSQRSVQEMRVMQQIQQTQPQTPLSAPIPAQPQSPTSQAPDVAKRFKLAGMRRTSSLKQTST